MSIEIASRQRRSGNRAAGRRLAAGAVLLGALLLLPADLAATTARDQDRGSRPSSQGHDRSAVRSRSSVGTDRAPAQRGEPSVRGSRSGRHSGRPHHGHYPRRYHGHRYYGPSFSASFGFHHLYPYGFYGPYAYYPYATAYGERYYRERMGALDLNVKPDRAIVYIDGNPIGEVDKFDGFPSFLWLEEGTYQISFFLEGYGTITREYTIYPDVVIDIDQKMQPGESVRPETLYPKATVNRDRRLQRDRERQEAVARREEAAVREAGIGRLLLTVTPADAAVYLDGHFLGTGDELAQLSAGLVLDSGEHTLEVVRPGYVTEEIPLAVDDGERLDLAVELEPR